MYSPAIPEGFGVNQSRLSTDPNIFIDPVLGFFVSDFGSSLSLSADGSILAVGALSGKSGRPSGGAYLFVQDIRGDWKQQAVIGPKTGPFRMSYFGSSLSLSSDGRVLAVAAPGDDSQATGVNGDQTDDSEPFSGAVYMHYLIPQNDASSDTR